MDLDPHSFIAQVTFSHEKDGPKSKTKVTIDTEDIIAIVTGLVAILFAVAMIVGWAPINAATIGIATCSGAGTVIAEIIKARGTRKTPAKKPEKPPSLRDNVY
jgi:hypothetical protein